MNTSKYKLSTTATPLLLVYLYLGMVALLILLLYLCWAACRNRLPRFTSYLPKNTHMYLHYVEIVYLSLLRIYLKNTYMYLHYLPTHIYTTYLLLLLIHFVENCCGVC